MTRRLYLHVGAPKSGTTYLQAVLRSNRQRLADAGVLVVGRDQHEVVRAGLIIRHDRRVASMSQQARGSWDRLVQDIHAWSGPVAVFSYELLSAADSRSVRTLLARFPDHEVHVVFTARDFGRSLPSAYQERLKFGLARPLERWAPSEEDEPWIEWGWRTLDPARVLARWAESLPPERVHVVTVPPPGAERGELWRRFARACGIDDVEVDLSIEFDNESLAPPAVELLRRANPHLKKSLAGDGEFSRWVRDVLAHQVLGPLSKREALGVSDEQYAEALRHSSAAITELRERGYDVQGDLEDIRATRPRGRSPSEVEDSELLDLAVQALARLLAYTRDAELQRHEASGDPTVRSRALGAARRVDRAMRATGQRIRAARSGGRSGT